MDATEQANNARDKIMGDMKTVINDAEELLRNTQQQAGEGFLAAKARFEATLNTAKAELIRIEETLLARTKDAALATDRYVKDHPWESVGLGACVGVIFGLLIARR